MCWGACNEQCSNADPDAIAGYCCSGANHFAGDGAVSNGDCPADAVAAVTTTVHSYVIKKKKKVRSVFQINYR